LTVRVRFAPSPTGPLHIGGARSALFNWLFAKKNNGKFIVRIEDTDLERSSRESETNILESLKWLGLTWDEGIYAGGDRGPYRQTERLDVYREYAKKLINMGAAYYCYCAEEDLKKERESQLAKGEMPKYSGRCRHLNEDDRKKLEQERRKAVVRFKVPDRGVIFVDDVVRGKVEFECSGIGDFIIMKSDGIATYNFAVVVDDHLMNISHVIRAEEHLSNTPRQLLLYDALGWEKPVFAHISLILGSDRSKMSKRHGATSIEQYKSQGYLPEALVNFLALLGWSPKGEEEIFSLEELSEIFSLEGVSKSPAVFDVEKLNWLNGYYIRNSNAEYIAEQCLPYLKEAGYIDYNALDMEKIKKIVLATRDYLSNLSEITQYAAVFFEPVDIDELKLELSDEKTKLVLSTLKKKIEEIGDIDEQAIKKLLKNLTKDLGFGGKKVFMPIRMALTGKKSGPELYQIIDILGKDTVIERLSVLI